jgi:hypothetical protein
LGEKYYNDTLVLKGYKNSKIIHTLSRAVSYENNKYTNPISFYSGNKKIYSQPLKYSGKEFMLTTTISVKSNSKLNNTTYDYYSKGMPFLKNLGLMFLEYNKNR